MTIDDLPLRKLLVQRTLLADQIRRAAAEVARDWMVERGLDTIRVDDENTLPCYARDYDDETLDMAVGNLDGSLFHNPSNPARWEPVLRLSELNEYLTLSDLPDLPAPQAARW